MTVSKHPKYKSIIGEIQKQLDEVRKAYEGRPLIIQFLGGGGFYATDGETQKEILMVQSPTCLSDGLSFPEFLEFMREQPLK